MPERAEGAGPVPVVEAHDDAVHPESYCHKCGGPNPVWTSIEWVQLTGSHSGVLCPVCFAALDPDAIWVVTRWAPPDADQVAMMVELLGVVSDLGDDAERVARCIVDAGFTR